MCAAAYLRVGPYIYVGYVGFLRDRPTQPPRVGGGVSLWGMPSTATGDAAATPKSGLHPCASGRGTLNPVGMGYRHNSGGLPAGSRI